jgi:hypothetical protein
MVAPSAVSFDSIQIRDQYLRDNRTLLTGLIGRRRGEQWVGYLERVLGVEDRCCHGWSDSWVSSVVAAYFEHGVQQERDAMPVGFER